MLYSVIDANVNFLGGPTYNNQKMYECIISILSKSVRVRRKNVQHAAPVYASISVLPAPREHASVRRVQLLQPVVRTQALPPIAQSVRVADAVTVTFFDIFPPILQSI